MNLPIEDLITALNENTAALKAVLAASSADVKVVHTITPAAITPEEAPAPKRGKVTKPAPAPEPDPVEEAPEPEVSLTPTKVPTPAAKDDTPHVPAPVAPGQPEAGEHVDVDELLSSIQSTLKKKMMAEGADAKAIQAAFVTIRTSYGVERINELKSNPAALLDILKKTQAL